MPVSKTGPGPDEIADFVAEFNAASREVDDDQDAAIEVSLKKHPKHLYVRIVEPVVGLIDGKKLSKPERRLPPASKGGIIPEDSATHSYLRDGGICVRIL